MFFGLTLSVWIQIGQTLALQYGTYVVDKKNNTIVGCPDDWLNGTVTPEPGPNA